MGDKYGEYIVKIINKVSDANLENKTKFGTSKGAFS